MLENKFKKNMINNIKNYELILENKTL
jgi:hypothetical protein